MTDTSATPVPLGNMQISTFDTFGRRVSPATTNLNGEYTTTGLAAGTYYVSMGAYLRPFPSDPFDSSSGLGFASEGTYDVTLGINVVDLGLVYGIRVAEDNTATIDMTLTSAACPLTDVIEDQTRSVLLGGDRVVDDYTINWVWMPPWGPEKITEDGREQLRALGFTV